MGFNTRHVHRLSLGLPHLHLSLMNLTLISFFNLNILGNSNMSEPTLLAYLYCVIFPYPYPVLVEACSKSLKQSFFPAFSNFRDEVYRCRHHHDIYCRGAIDSRPVSLSSGLELPEWLRREGLGKSWLCYSRSSGRRQESQVSLQACR